MKKALILLCAFLCIESANAQFQVNYIHTNPLKFNIENFNQVQIISTTPKSSVRVKYVLLDEKDKPVVEINFPLQDLNQGTNYLRYEQGETKWFNSPYRDLLLTNNLRTGNFQLCVSVTDIYETIPEADECFEVELESIDIEDPLNAEPIELDEPEKNDSIEEIRPMLSWIPPSPTHKGTNYQLILVEKKENQTCTEALNNNLPIINKKGIPTNIIGFPSESQALEKGHNYCWRVAAHKDLKEYSRSEDWKFTVKGIVESSLPYIEEIANKHIIFNEEDFRFIIKNRSRSGTLSISIDYIDAKKNKSLHKDLVQEVQYGDNIIVISKEDIARAGTYVFKLKDLSKKIYTWQLKVN